MSGESTSTVRLTGEQRLALEVRGSSVALGAGAGCGKTMVLTERFLGEIAGDGGRALQAPGGAHLHGEGVPRAAAADPRRCREQIALGPAADRWRSVLRALEAAPIGTFHEFCGRILRACAVEVGVDPEFAILDESIAASLRDRAVRTVVRRMLAERDPDLMHLGLDYGLGQIREALLDPDRQPDRRRPGRLERAFRRRADRPLDRGLDREGPARRAADPPAPRPAVPGRSSRSWTPSIRSFANGGSRSWSSSPSSRPAPAATSSLAEVRELARVNDLGAKGIWPSPEIKEAVKDLFEALRKKIDKVFEKSRFSEALTRESAENSAAAHPAREPGQARVRARSRRRGAGSTSTTC